MPGSSPQPTYLVFEFPDRDSASGARRRIDAWANAYKLVYEQLGAVVVPGDDANRVLVRLAFSQGEQLSFERWLERIPTEEPFDNADCRVVAAGSPEYDQTAASFSRLAAN